MSLKDISITPKLLKTTLLIDVGLNICAVGTLVDPVADTIKNLVKWKQATSVL
jgi:hypothetical protein